MRCSILRTLAMLDKSWELVGEEGGNQKHGIAPYAANRIKAMSFLAGLGIPRRGGPSNNAWGLKVWAHVIGFVEEFERKPKRV